MDKNLEKNARRFLKLASRLRRLGSESNSADDVQVSPSQLGLFEAPGPDLDHRVAEVVDRLSERYGRGTVTRAAMLEEKRKS